jgi:hypothetical protein
VSEPERVVIDAPSASTRGLGTVAIIVGGLTSGLAVYGLYVNCEQNPFQWSTNCLTEGKAPYWLVVGGVGLTMGAVGIVLFVNNDKPSVEVLPALGTRTRREPGTFVGFRPVEGSTLPGLTLRASF